MFQEYLPFEGIKTFSQTGGKYTFLHENDQKD